MSPISEITNEIFDQGTFKDGDIWTVMLGVVVTLLPKIAPRIMPNFIPDKSQRDRFEDPNYIVDVENMFRSKFIENLKVIEDVVMAWKDNTLEPEQFGLPADSAFAKEDLNALVGDPEAVQNELLSGINFLRYRMERSDSMESGDDHINRLASTIWKSAMTAYDIIFAYFNHIQ